MLEKLLFPALPACLLLLGILVLAVVVSVGMKNKFRTHR